MCGIAGIFHRRGERPNPRLLDAMTDSLVHRGPDARGTFRHEGVGLGHRRLSIIGIDDGAQPMSNEDGKIWISYNGEIYNYQDLRSELEALGHVFKSKADTEVIVHGYEAWGDDVVMRLRGIFAYAVYDSIQKRVVLARDRLGVKPLYYHLTPDLLLFGSEPKALLAHESMPSRPNLDAIHLYLRYGYCPAPYAAFEGMNQLEPGSMLAVTEGDSRLRSYWTPGAVGSSPHSVRAEMDAQIDSSVAMELMSEVPLGAFLSGGIDSSVVAASMSRAQKHPKTFCIGFPEPAYDESKYSKQVAQALGLDHHVELVSKDELDLMDRLVSVYDEPFSDSSALPTYVLCQMARRHVTVALSGDGGDEVFGGYRRYKKLAHFVQLPPLAQRALGIAADFYPASYRGWGRLARLSRDVGAQYDFEISTASRTLRGWTTPELHRKVDWSIAGVFAKAPGDHAVQKAQWVDLVTYLPYDILTKVDRASMAHGLEVRVPLLDHVFVEWALGLPPTETFGGGAGKVALKAHLAGRISPAIFARPKMGFGVPLEYWLGGSGGLTARVEKLRARHPRRDFFAPLRTDAVLALARHKRPSQTSHALWSLLFLETWWQKHFC